MGGLGRAIRTWNGARLDGPEAKLTSLTRGDAAISFESFMPGLVLLVIWMVILAERIRLPDLDHRIWNRNTIAIENPSFDHDVLARNTLWGDVRTV